MVVRARLVPPPRNAVVVDVEEEAIANKKKKTKRVVPRARVPPDSHPWLTILLGIVLLQMPQPPIVVVVDCVTIVPRQEK